MAKQNFTECPRRLFMRQHNPQVAAYNALGSDLHRMASKLALCLRIAKEASRDSWQHAENAQQRREFKRISRECLQSARYWRDQLKTYYTEPKQ